MKKIILVLVIVSLLLTFSNLTACTTPEVILPSLSEDEQTEADIYAAVVRQVYTSGSSGSSKIYLVAFADDRIGGSDILWTESKQLLESVQVTIPASLDDLYDLSAEFIWVEDRSEVPLDSNGSVRGNGAIISLSTIHFQEDGTALVSASIYFALLSASGRTYIVEQVNST